LKILLRVFAAAVLVLGLVAAKSEIGQDFNDANLPKLEIGKTTLQEAVTLLGAQPQISTVGHSGATAYTWQYIESKASLWTGKSSAQSKLVMLVFNTDGTFQRILQMQGITLDPDSHQRLFSAPAAAARQSAN